MLQRDLCYWLQGFFELAETDTLTAIQLREINKHLDMALLRSDPSQPKALAFCQYLKIELSDTDFRLNKIKSLLSQVFVHEIDLSFPNEDQSTLNQIHNYDPNSGIMRC